MFHKAYHFMRWGWKVPYGEKSYMERKTFGAIVHGNSTLLGVPLFWKCLNLDISIINDNDCKIKLLLILENKTAKKLFVHSWLTAKHFWSIPTSINLKYIAFSYLCFFYKFSSNVLSSPPHVYQTYMCIFSSLKNSQS